MKTRKLGVRITAFLLAVMMMCLLAVSAFASQTGKTRIYGGNSKVAVIRTGRPYGGWRSSSPIYVQNKGSKPITVYGATGYRYAFLNGVKVWPGGCRTFYLNNNRTFYITVQASGGTSDVNVYASRPTTSVWWG